MSSYERWAEDQEELERKKRDLERDMDDREIGIIAQAQIQREIDKINEKLSK